MCIVLECDYANGRPPTTLTMGGAGEDEWVRIGHLVDGLLEQGIGEVAALECAMRAIEDLDVGFPQDAWLDLDGNVVVLVKRDEPRLAPTR